MNIIKARAYIDQLILRVATLITRCLIELPTVIYIKMMKISVGACATFRRVGSLLH